MDSFAMSSALAARLSVVHTRLCALTTGAAPHAWFPGARRGATLSDLLRSLDGPWPAAGPCDLDPWAVPVGMPDGAERWLTPASAAADVGADRTVRAVQLDPEALRQLLAVADAAAQPDRPVEVAGRWWGQRDGTDLSGWMAGGLRPGAWLEVGGVSSVGGPDGPVAVVAATSTWRVLGEHHLQQGGTPGRDGFVVVSADPNAPDDGTGPAIVAVPYLLADYERADPAGSGLEAMTEQLRTTLLRSFALRLATAGLPV